MADLHFTWPVARRLIPLLMLSVVVAAILTLPGHVGSLNDRVTKVRYAYRAWAPGALGGDGRLVLRPFHQPLLEPGPGLDERIPGDSGLSAQAIQSLDDLVFTPPFEVRLRVRGDDPSAVRLYFAQQRGRGVYLRLDPAGELPTRVVVDRNEPFDDQGLGFIAPYEPEARPATSPYHEYAVRVATNSIVVSSGEETRTIPVRGSLEPGSIRLAPVVGPRLSILDEIEVTSGSSSASARATYRLRPLLYPFDLESRLGDRPSLYLVVSLLLLAAASLLFSRLRDVALRGFPTVRSQYAVGLLTLPAHIVTLSAVRATLGLALLSTYAAVALLVVFEVYGLRRVRPQAKVYVIRSHRLVLWLAAVSLSLALVVHAFVYRVASLDEFSLGLGIVACAAVFALGLWRVRADRRVWLWPTLVVPLQCLLLAPSRVFHPAVTPITFYALSVLVWIVVVLHNGETSAASKRTPAWILAVLSPALLIVLFEVALRGDHHLRHLTSQSCIVAEAENEFLRLALEYDRAVDDETSQDSTIEMGGTAWRIEKPAGQLRIVCLGSSSTFGVGVDSFEDSYPARLGELLRSATGDDIVTLNAGLAGARLSFLEFYVDRVLLHLDPDIVVVYFGSNGDPPGLARDLERFGTWLDHDPTAEPTFEEIWAAMQLRWPRPWLVQGLVRAMASRTVNWSILTTRNVQAAASANEPNVVQRYTDLDPEQDSAFDIVELCRSRGVPVLFVPEVTFKENAEGCQADPAVCSHAYYHIFGSLAARSTEDAVYSGTVLRDFPPEIRETHLVDEVHMNRDGYARLARSIADLLVEKELIDIPESGGGVGADPSRSP